MYCEKANLPASNDSTPGFSLEQLQRKTAGYRSGAFQQRFSDDVAVEVHPDGMCLYNGCVSININNQSWQLVAFAMHEPEHVVAVLVHEPQCNTELECLANAFFPKCRVNDGGNQFLIGQTDDNIALEYGLKFHIDWLRGQKTGFFVDQRENRKLLEKYAKGRRVLNMFCYTGFSRVAH